MTLKTLLLSVWIHSLHTLNKAVKVHSSQQEHFTTSSRKAVDLEGHMGDVDGCYPLFLTQDSDVIDKDRTFATAHMDFPSQTNNCFPSTRQEFLRFLVTSSDVHFKTIIWVPRVEERAY